MADIRPSVPPRPQRLLDQIRRHLRDGGYAWKTEKTYVHWIKRFILFHGKQHPATLSHPHIEQFLSALANEHSCSPATQRIALNALIYFYRKFLGVDLEPLRFERARIKPRLPVVLTHSEAMRILSQLKGINRVMAALLYGSGMRLNELLSLRVKDVDFAMGIITVRSGKGDKDRVTLLP
jgi:integrase